MERVHFLDQPQATEHDGNGFGSHRIPGGKRGLTWTNRWANKRRIWPVSFAGLGRPEPISMPAPVHLLLLLHSVSILLCMRTFCQAPWTVVRSFRRQFPPSIDDSSVKATDQAGAPGQHLPQSQFYSNRIDPANPTEPVNPTRLFQLTPYTTKNLLIPCTLARQTPSNPFQPPPAPPPFS